jgi:hypothetical protein
VPLKLYTSTNGALPGSAETWFLPCRLLWASAFWVHNRRAVAVRAPAGTYASCRTNSRRMRCRSMAWLTARNSP